MRVRAVVVPAAALLLSACSTWNVNLKDAPPEFPAPLPLDAYANTDGLRDYDGNIIDATFLGTGARQGELLHLQVWPFVGIGVGALGVRLQLLPLDVGVGTILYAPSRPTGSGVPTGE